MVLEIIQTADLETCTPKSIRASLEEEFQIDLEPLRDVINQTINKAVEQRLDKEDTEASASNSASEFEKGLDDKQLAQLLQEEENRQVRSQRRSAVKAQRPAKVKGKRMSRPQENNPFNRACLLSPALADLVGAKEMSRPQVVKALWAYIKANDLQDPADRRNIRCDEKFKALFKRPRISCFSMNKYLSDHLKRIDDIVEAPSTDKGGTDPEAS